MVVASVQSGHLVLKWQHASLITSYEIWRSTDPYLNPAAPAMRIASGLPPVALPTFDVVCTQSLDGDTRTCTLSGGVGDVTKNYFYIVKGIRSGVAGATSNRTGEFDFALAPGG